jgi:Fe-S-cluster containining protein
MTSSTMMFANAHYSCTGCGECCRGWKVPILPGEAERFRRLAEPLVPVERLTRALVSQPQKNGSTDEYISVGDGCIALGGDGLCRIHVRHGSEAKPAVCRLFPLTFVQTPTEVRVGLSFACSAVLDATGPLLSQQRDEIEALYTTAIAGTKLAHRVGDTVALTPRLKLPWTDAARLIADVVAQLRTEAPLVEKLCCAEALLLVLEEELAHRRPFDEALETARTEHAATVAQLLSEPPDTTLGARALFRTLCRAFEDDESARSRVWSILVAASGGGARVRLPDGVVPVAALERVAPYLPDEADALYSRWITLNVESLGFFGESVRNLSLVAGFQLLTMGAAVAMYLARAHAALHGRAFVSIDDARFGLRQAERCIHHSSRQIPRWLERALLSTSCLDVLRLQIGTVRAQAA